MPSMRDIKQRKLAAQATAPVAVVAENTVAAQAGEGVSSSPSSATRSPADNAAHLMQVRLLEDRRRLKDIQSAERKAGAKLAMLPEYESWIKGQLEADLPKGQPNDVLTTVMVWSIDAGQFIDALAIAEKVLALEIPLPSQFERQAPTLIAEEVAEAGFSALRAKESFDRTIVEAAMELTQESDMPDQVRAKLFKLRAQLLEGEADAVEEAGGEKADGPAGQYRKLLTEAADSAQRAVVLDPDCGAKTLLRGLERRIKKLFAPENAETNTT